MILMYHNVVTDDAPAGCNRTSITIPVSSFTRQIEWINRHFKIISLDEYLERKLEGSLTQKYVAITFDDGTAMTYDLVSPIFEQFKIPAAIFVSTCQLEGGDLIWGSTINAICLEDSYSIIEWEGLQLSMTNIKERMESRQALIKVAMESGNPIVFAKELIKQFPISKEIMPFYEGMKYHQLENAGKSYWSTIGSHTVSHPDLRTLHEKDQVFELYNSRIKLEEIMNKSIDYFCYPYGEYNLITLKILKDLRYKAAFAVKPKSLGDDSIYEIQRIGIFSKSLSVLKYKLGGISKLLNPF